MMAVCNLRLYITASIEYKLLVCQHDVLAGEVLRQTHITAMNLFCSTAPQQFWNRNYWWKLPNWQVSICQMLFRMRSKVFWAFPGKCLRTSSEGLTASQTQATGCWWLTTGSLTTIITMVTNPVVTKPQLLSYNWYAKFTKIKLRVTSYSAVELLITRTRIKHNVNLLVL